MENKAENSKQEPETKHKNQVLSQILIPILATTLVCLIVCIVLVVSSAGEAQSTEQWADISIMFMLLPTLFIGLVGLILLILLGRLTGNINKTLPASLRKIRLTVIRINQNIESAVQKPAKPFISFRSMFAGIKTIFHK